MTTHIALRTVRSPPAPFLRAVPRCPSDGRTGMGRGWDAPRRSVCCHTAASSLAAEAALLGIHILKHGAPGHAASAPHACDGTGQPLPVHGPTHAFPKEMRCEEVLDPQAGNHGLLKTAELTGQKGCRFTGC